MNVRRSERSLRLSSSVAPLDNSKVDDLRHQSNVRDDPEDHQDEQVPLPLTEDNKKGWSYFMQRNAVIRNYQKRLVFNNDLKVAALEFAIMLLSIAQLQWSYRSPYWREKRECAQRPGCIDTLPDSTFAAANAIRVIMAVLGLVRLFIRCSQLFKTKCHKRPTIRSKLECSLQYGLELAYTAILPYPFLETFFPAVRGDTFVVLSISVFLRTTSWVQWLYYPYPIQQKEKVASFSGNLEFSYRQFVIKKVLDDTPLIKLITFYVMLGVTVAYLLHVMETIKGHCSWEHVEVEVVRSEDAICYELYISDSLWMIFMTFLSIGYGDVSPKTGRGRAIISITACMAVMLDAMFFSIFIKKFSFSTMEARVHAFLYRMELCNKKDISAVLAVQATFRYNKSYKHSLIWHQERGTNIFYRPLSDRLPNEVKTKLYSSRFKKCLKQIIKYNTDGDPLNAFSKHVEVITAALGATFVDMMRLKKMYYRRIRVFEQRRQHANRRVSSFGMTSSGRSTVVALSGAGKHSPFPRAQSTSDPPSVPTVAFDPTADTGGVSAAWGDEMQRKCEATMLLLKKIESNMKGM
ncbi:potassium intermediate small conductance calcium-activated channel, sub N, member [Phytophthora pseudosyringae]|uniref:Potassium intermediate small conductance calcium-activated channel, sub N, member n=1 Tax=Phytophthora pseudosyringae TaxID=221518 RepID=A0A8T1WKH2_9STRA|nr:potassium intermediate small conductance calcium-activated channel, sub N, member [Phytophthora pseudosyringae]